MNSSRCLSDSSRRFFLLSVGFAIAVIGICPRLVSATNQIWTFSYTDEALLTVSGQIITNNILSQGPIANCGISGAASGYQILSITGAADYAAGQYELGTPGHYPIAGLADAVDYPPADLVGYATFPPNNILYPAPNPSFDCYGLGFSALLHNRRGGGAQTTWWSLSWVGDINNEHFFEQWGSQFVGNSISQQFGGPSVFESDIQLTLLTTRNSPQRIDAYAGRGPYKNVKAANAHILPWPLAITSAGDIYFGSAHYAVYRYNPKTQGVTLIAGNGMIGSFGDGGPAQNASFRGVSGLALDAAGNLYIADPANAVVRVVTPAGQISKYAGTGVLGCPTDGAQSNATPFGYPEYVNFDAANGNVLIADGACGLYSIDPTGKVNLLANAYPTAVTSSPQGDIYYIDASYDTARTKLPTDALYWIPAGSSTAQLMTPLGYCSEGLSFYSNFVVGYYQNLYTVDYCTENVYQITPVGAVSVVAGTGNPGGFSPDGTLATAAALADPADVAVGPDGKIYFTDNSNFLVRRFALGSTLESVIGAQGGGLPGPAKDILVNITGGLAADATGNLYIAATPAVVKIDTATHTASAFAGNGTFGLSGDGGPALSAQVLATGIATDGSGNVFLAEPLNNRVREIDTTGIIHTVAGSGQIVLGSGVVWPPGGFGPANKGDGGPATSAGLHAPNAVAVDGAGYVYVGGNCGAAQCQVAPRALDESVIRRFQVGGTIELYAGTYGKVGYGGDGGPATSAVLNNPVSFALDAAGNLYVADTFNHRVRMVNTQGIITTIAGTGTPGFSGDGGHASIAQLNLPSDVAVDSAGYIFIADSGNNCIRRIDPTGRIYTIAGNTIAGFSGDGGEAQSAQLNAPLRLTVDNANNLLYVLDANNNRVRKITAIDKPVF